MGTPTMLLARGLLMLSLLLILTMVPMDILAMDFLDSMGPDLMAMVPILTPLDPTPTTLLARGLLMLNPLLIPTMQLWICCSLWLWICSQILWICFLCPVFLWIQILWIDGNYIPPSANNQPPCMLPDSEEDLKFSCGRCH